MKVLKFGGTSVGEPDRMRQVLDISSQSDESNIVVLSALSGTTNSLVKLNSLLRENAKEQFSRELDELQNHYEDFIQKLYKEEKVKREAEKTISKHFEVINSFAQDVYTANEEKLMLAQGELMSTALFKLLCDEQGVKAELLPALDFMRINNNKEPDYYFIDINLKRLIEENKSDEKVIFITQGFICRNAYGEVDNLQRGGSDYTASLIGASINAEEIQIWTDIDGMHNNDPRIVKPTRPIQELSFDEAAELAYFGAKILHPSSVRPAKDANIPVYLKSTLNPQAKGTIVSQKSSSDRIKAVAAKDGIMAIKITSGRMLLAYGFLRHIFEVFEWYKKPIDLITTSEVAVSLTVDDDENLDAIVKDLEKYGSVEIDRDHTIICVVGDFLAQSAGYGAQILTALKEIPLRMVSYGGSNNNVSFLVESRYKKDALTALNSLFEIGRS